jgi:S-DNA-T family DNA segregation ATPase FtsK/SpoIIIE
MTDGPNWNAWFSRLRLGRWMDNGATAWLPFHGQHIFIAGETGYGKSNTERVILKELWPGIRAGAVEVIGFDAQLGVELQEVQDAGLLKEFYFGKEAGTITDEFKDGKPYEATFADALETHVEVMRQRTSDMRRMGMKEWVITTQQPARVILIDEAGQLFRKNVAASVKNRVIGAIDTLTYQSRKCGYVVVACTQHSNLDQIPIRHGLTFGVAHRMKTQHGYEQVTGNGWDMPPLPRGVQGLAYMSGQGKRILRTQFIPRLQRYREPIIVNSARMPTFSEDSELESVPNYGGPWNTVSGTVMDPDGEYLPADGYR